MRKALVACLVLYLCCVPAATAQAPPAPVTTPATSSPPKAAGPAVVDMQTVVVSGAQPGPGLWRVTRGDHTLWVLGTLAPLPKRMQWESRQVEGILAQAQEVIQPPSFTIDTGRGMLRSLMLVPSLLKARRNPEGRTLQQSVPPELYARWRVLKARYIGKDNGVEKWRPIFAAQELYEAAMRKSGLTMEGIVQPAVAKMAKRRKVPLTPVNAKLVLEDPKGAIKAFQNEALADTECFARTLDVIETDLEAMRVRANAWAVGDVEVLRNTPARNNYSACVAAVSETGLARKLGVDGLREKSIAAWLQAAESALQKNTVTFSTLPLGLLLEPGGVMDKLKAKGYEVQGPTDP